MLRVSVILIIFSIILFFILSTPAHSSSTLLRLTNTAENALNLNPVLSDDGRIVVFESTSDLASVGGPDSFHTIRASIAEGGSGFEDVARSRASSKSVSGSGERVVFASSEDLVGQNADRNSEIYLTDGSNLRQLTHTRCESEVTRLTDGNFDPSISNDGRWAVFVSNRNLSAPAIQELFLLDTTSASITQLTNSELNVYPANAKISANGSRIFFLRKHVGVDTVDLVLLEVENRTSQVVVENLPELSLSPGRAISNDGNRVVYSASIAANQSQVFLFDLRLGEPRQLTKLGTRSTDVALNASISGDGKRITFATRRRVSNPSDGSVELYLLDIPTGIIQQLTTAPSNATAEVISSLNNNGSVVAFSFPRVLSGAVVNDELVNNSEIYIAFPAMRPEFGEATVTNAANRVTTNPQIAPDSIASIIGNQLCSRVEQAKLVEGALPFSISGTTVQVNGKPASLIYASPEEVFFVVPTDIVDGSAEILVTNSEGFPAKAHATVSRTAPGVFSKADQAIILNAETFAAAPFDPTNGDLRVVIFATGVRHATEVFINLGGESVKAERVLASTFPGLDEVHLRIPEHLRGAGPVTFMVKAGSSESNLVSTNINGSSLRDIMINEILTDPPDGLAGDANHDGSRDSSADEFVELINTTARDLDLTGYQLQSRTFTATSDTVRHRFPAGTILHAGTALVVFGGGQIDRFNPLFGSATVSRASTSGLSLSNTGGVVTLRDASGVIINSVRYGENLGVRGDANQSITRVPDGGGVLQLHQVASGSEARSFSPGTRVDGSGFSPSPAIAHISVTPLFVELLKGQITQFAARAFDADNRELHDVIFGWNSSDPAIVTIDGDGTAKAMNAGMVEITARGRRVESPKTFVTVVAPTPTPIPTPTPVPTPSPSPTPLPAIVISEFRTRGPNGASDEFVEIYNNSELSVNLSGWKLRASSSTGTISNRLILPNGITLPGRKHLLLANSAGYSGAVLADLNFTSGFANDGGLAITLPNDAVVDQVGLSSGASFREGMHLSPLPNDANQSYERKPGGLFGSTQDTQDNLTDFQLVPSDPQNTHSNSTPGPAPSPSPSPTVSPTPSPSPSPLPSPSPSPTPATRGVVISQVFGGGGNSGSPFRNDFIEIFNAGSAPVSLLGWSVQYASVTASVWSITSLTDVSLAPGQYYLIQQASGGSNGQTLSTVDATGTISLAATAGKVALVRSTTPLSGGCPADPNVVDLVGYGTTSGCFEGAAPAAAPSNSTAIVRNFGGCSDSGNNAVDFATSTPAPRNTASTFNSCSIATAHSSKLIDEFCWVFLSTWWVN